MVNSLFDRPLPVVPIRPPPRATPRPPGQRFFSGATCNSSPMTSSRTAARFAATCGLRGRRRNSVCLIPRISMRSLLRGGGGWYGDRPATPARFLTSQLGRRSGRPISLACHSFPRDRQHLSHGNVGLLRCSEGQALEGGSVNRPVPFIISPYP
ncbi:hypothetical protein LX36DRAFT_496384 [Colletotrichum falcatum]|nr:hypothetical protein LX36DRAFT_496384 [Colletotrichum falcatum]